MFKVESFLGFRLTSGSAMRAWGGSLSVVSGRTL